MAAVTYLTRVSFLLLTRWVAFPEPVSRGLKYVPVGILTAFVIPGVLVSGGRLNFSWQNHYLFAGLLAAMVAWKWKNVFLAMGSGVALLLILRALA